MKSICNDNTYGQLLFPKLMCANEYTREINIIVFDCHLLFMRFFLTDIHMS